MNNMGDKMQKFGLDKKVIEDIIDILKKYEEVEKASIFGSRAKGTYRESSDIDIAIFGENLTDSIHTKIYFDIEDLYLVYKIDLINFNNIKDTDAIKQSILNEGVEFYAK